MELHYRFGEALHAVRVKRAGEGRFRIEVGGRAREVVLRRAEAGSFELLVDGTPLHAATVADGERRLVALRGAEPLAIERADKKKRRARPAGGTDDLLAANMHGQVAAVLVKEGDLVERGQALVILEAMKMEMRISAPHDGRVKKISCKTGDVVERGKVLVEMEAAKAVQ